MDVTDSTDLLLLRSRLLCWTGSRNLWMLASCSFWTLLATKLSRNGSVHESLVVNFIHCPLKNGNTILNTKRDATKMVVSSICLETRVLCQILLSGPDGVHFSNWMLKILSFLQACWPFHQSWVVDIHWLPYTDLLSGSSQYKAFSCVKVQDLNNDNLCLPRWSTRLNDALLEAE